MLYFVAVGLLSFAVAILSLIAGIEWITIGYGLNPFLAFPLALFFGLMALHYALIVQADLMVWNFTRKARKDRALLIQRLRAQRM